MYKADAILESWIFFARKKVDEGWTLSLSKHPNKQFLKNPDKEAKVKRINYLDYAKAVKALFYKATIYLTNGEPLSTNGCGTIKAARVERDTTKLQMTKGTIARLGRGEIIPIRQREYITEPDVCRMKWHRPPRLTIEEGADRDRSYLRDYKFDIARDNKGTGFKQRFSASNSENPTLKFSYDFNPNRSTNFLY